jgi:hypothetical protein
MGTDTLVFLKQLLDNAEFANETGVLNVVKLFKHEDPDVTEGTSYAPGAFETLKNLIERRPELLTPAVVRELEALAQDSDPRICEAACRVLGAGGRKPACGSGGGQPASTIRLVTLMGLVPATAVLAEWATLFRMISERPVYQDVPPAHSPKGLISISLSLGGVATNIRAAATALETGVGMDGRPIARAEIATGLRKMCSDLWGDKGFRSYMTQNLGGGFNLPTAFELKRRYPDDPGADAALGDCERVRQGFAILKSVARAIEGSESTSFFSRIWRWW